MGSPTGEVARWGRLCQGPGPVEAGEAEVEQSAQVQPGHPVVQPQVVGGGSAEPQPPVPAGDQPGDGAFDHGPMLTVGGLELWVLGAAAVTAQEGVVWVQPQRPAAA